jgi:putative transposase
VLLFAGAASASCDERRLFIEVRNVIDMQALPREYAMLASMSRRGSFRDNAPIESLFNSLKDERVHTQRHTTRDEARQDIFEYIEAFYNRSRRHSALAYVSPAQHYAAWQAEHKMAA